MKEYIDSTVREDFNKARTGAVIHRILNLFTPTRQELLSLHEVKSVLRPRGEHYRGLQTVPIDAIVGSEGRYNDFNKQFLPRYEYLRKRWESVDRAHLTDVNLPAISLYEIGGVYFVRDGNHRVSVAKAQGVISIDAEVVSLDTEIPLQDASSPDTLKRSVIAHEKRLFYDRTRFQEIVGYDLELTATGRYDEIENHILGHKYYLNEHQTVEIPMDQAMVSWFLNVFMPIVTTIEEHNLIARFPGRTSADLYLWIVKHWDDLKRRYGEDIPVVAAAMDYSNRYGTGLWSQIRVVFRRLIARRKRGE